MSRNLSSPVYGNTVVTVVTLAIEENGSKIAFLSHSTCTAPVCPQRKMSYLLQTQHFGHM